MQKKAKKAIKLDKPIKDFLVKCFEKRQESPTTKIKNLKNYISMHTNDGDYHLRMAKEFEKKVEEYKEKLAEAEKIREDVDAVSTINKQFSNIASHVLVDTVDFYENFDGSFQLDGTEHDYNLSQCLVVKTKKLKYTGQKLNFNLDPFLIFIWPRGGRVKAYNTKKQYKVEFSHPCVRNGLICFGSFDSVVSRLVSDFSLDGLIFLIINFLQKPNYGSPYVSEEAFIHAQPLGIKYKHETEIAFNHSYKWDQNKFELAYASGNAIALRTDINDDYNDDDDEDNN